MRIPQLLLGLVIAIALLLGAATWIPEDAALQASPHPEHPTLLRAGAGAAATPAVLVLGWVFGLLQIAFFAGCFALGMQRAGRLGPIARPLVLGSVLYAALWTGLVLAYAATGGDPDPPRLGSFPLATAWMLYGLWPFPLYFAGLYLYHFKDWFLNEEDLARYRARVAELAARREEPGEGGGPSGEEGGR